MVARLDASGRGHDLTRTDRNCLHALRNLEADTDALSLIGLREDGRGEKREADNEE
jgi:hypothetical protein